jgi:phytoene/squalene synthetase
MMDIMEFDVKRRDKLISEGELEWYSDTLGTSVIDAILFFVGNTPPFSRDKGGYAAGIAAHMAHMLRDMRADISNGFVNIPREYLEKHGLEPADMDQPAYQSWVRERVKRTRELFVRGRHFLDQLDNLHLRIVGQLYSARFDHVLATIQSDDYLLREDYGNRRAIANWLRMATIATRISLHHMWSRLTGKPSGEGS